MGKRLDSFNDRYSEGVTPAHSAANLLHLQTMGINLTNNLIDKAIDYISQYATRN